MQLEARFISGVAEILPEDWDRLVGDGSPFFEWAFLNACEAASCVPRNGVQAQHVTIYEGDELVAALPLYLKGDGRGEFIYDYAWYHFAARNGLDYYPKALSMSPFTPVTGPHLLVAPGHDPMRLMVEVASVVEHWAKLNELPGVHYLFVPDDEADLLEAAGYLRRLTFQLNWVNEGFATFEDFLQRFRHKDRVKIKRERRRLREHGLSVEVVRGDAIGTDDLEAMHRFYTRTCAWHGTGSDYLKRRTWELLFEDWKHRLVLFMAVKDGERVGGSLCVHKGDDLYGRYWGSCGEFPDLYFNLAFYEPMTFAIAEGIQRFWVGFGNSRAKFARGLQPSPTNSVHCLFDPALARVIAAHLEEDRIHTRAEIEAARKASKLKPQA